MSRDDVQRLVAAAIRDHELRVALWSGPLGAAAVAVTCRRISCFADVFGGRVKRVGVVSG